MSPSARFALLPLLTLSAALAGCRGDCVVEDCSEFDGGDPDKEYESCTKTKSTGTYGVSGSKADFILYDMDGEELFRCEHETDPAGESITSCPDDFAEAKYDYCFA